MNRAVNRLRLFFCTFSGEDNYIINRCETRIQISFALIGLFVIIVFIGCWLSADLFMDHIFAGNQWMSAFVGIVWAMLVTNLYLLLLYTISPTILPVAKKKKNRKGKISSELNPKLTSAFTTSFIFRIAFILLLAIIIIQPFNAYIFGISDDNTEYAKQLRNILSTNQFSWLTTVLGCFIFLLPIYWKYGIRNRGGFYEKKKRIENKFVHDNYSDFETVYTSIFNEKISCYNRQTWENIMPLLNKLEKLNPAIYRRYYEKMEYEIVNETIVKYEYWADPPFRTIHKKIVRNLSSEGDFLKDIYSENI